MPHIGAGYKTVKAAPDGGGDDASGYARWPIRHDHHTVMLTGINYRANTVEPARRGRRKCTPVEYGDRASPYGAGLKTAVRGPLFGFAGMAEPDATCAADRRPDDTVYR